MCGMAIENFTDMVKDGSALRRIRRLQPIGGKGDYIAPPTYLDENDKPTHIFETRRIGNESVQCVLLDSVQSQANRLEEALSKAIATHNLTIPHVRVNFTKFESVKDLGIITSLQTPHRIFDAIIRDSTLNGVNFLESEVGKAVGTATINNARMLFRYSPTTLVFGGWNSTSDIGGSGPRFQRCVVSEIIGANVEKSNKPSSRLDPLQIEKIDIYVVSKTDWSVEKTNNGRKKKPSEIVHGNIAPSFTGLGITMDYALQTTVITLAGLRHLSFPDGNGKTNLESDQVAWSTLASIAILAILEQDKRGYALRSRCDLVPETPNSNFELIHNDGTIEELNITYDDALTLFRGSIKAAKDAGLEWNDDPIEMAPQKRLVKLIEQSRKKSLTDSR